MTAAVVAVGWLAWHRDWDDYVPAMGRRASELGRLSADPRALGVTASGNATTTSPSP